MNKLKIFTSLKNLFLSILFILIWRFPGEEHLFLNQISRDSIYFESSLSKNEEIFYIFKIFLSFILDEKNVKGIEDSLSFFISYLYLDIKDNVDKNILTE